MKRYLFIVALVIAGASGAGCASKLDAVSTAQNAKNVRTLVRHVDELHVAAKDDPSLRKADAETGASFIELADKMAAAAAR